MPTELTLITGASAGIGQDLARLFAADRSDLVLVARRTERLEQLASELTARQGVKVTVLPLDLAAPGAAAQLEASLHEKNLEVDVLVNNAGFGGYGKFVNLDLKRQMSMIQLNVATLVELSHRLLPGMIRRNRGGVLNVASTAAFQPGPTMAVYYATKAFVLSFTEALAEELRGTALKVSGLCPGPTYTEFAEAADMTHSRLFKLGAMTSLDVARAGHAGFRAGRVVVIPGWRNKFGAFSVRFTPRALVRRVVARIQKSTAS
jgi:short-subunit dehydrogenase